MDGYHGVSGYNPYVNVEPAKANPSQQQASSEKTEKTSPSPTRLEEGSIIDITG